MDSIDCHAPAQVSAAQVHLVLEPLESGGAAAVQPVELSGFMGLVGCALSHSNRRTATGTIGAAGLASWTASEGTLLPNVGRRPLKRSFHVGAMRGNRLFCTAVRGTSEYSEHP